MKDYMQYHGYYGSVHFDENDLIFHGKIEFIRALVSYEATDAKGLKKHLLTRLMIILNFVSSKRFRQKCPLKAV